MRILLVYPETPATFWSFKDALRFVSKKSSEPPLGLLTVAAMLPRKWQLRLMDMNVSPLRDEDILWADYLFLSGMSIQLNSMKTVVQRAHALQRPVIGGGPLLTTEPDAIPEVDCLVLNEAENTLPEMLADLQNGKLKKVYRCAEYPDISQTPAPRWDLLEMDKYASMSVQYSRGCPFNCEFCCITELNGHKPRVKRRAQFIWELESLYRLGWRGSVFIVDDNFIGNRRALKEELLPALKEWSRLKNYPFSFMTEASVNLADDEELVDMMVAAGFDAAFLGIETPNPESLQECGKTQNKSRDLMQAVKKLQQRGIMVSGGFIVGFDHDPPNIFEQMIQFIQQSGVVTAMVGLLNAPTGTKLFERLRRENRLISRMTGDNTDGSTNIIPKMDLNELKAGYRRVIETIYSPGEYYQRVKTLLNNYSLPPRPKVGLKREDILAFFRSIWVLGIREPGKRYYWKLLGYSLFRHPRKFALAVRLAIYGFHFRRVAQRI